jgi:hypothetical protein
VADAVELKRARKIGAAVGRFRHGQLIYGLHVLAVLMPGEAVRVFRAHQIKAVALDGWSGEELDLMVEEGRRQLDRQLSDLERIRGRSQWLFSIGAAVTVAVAGALAGDEPNAPRLLLWLAALALVVYGTAGAAAVMTVRADFKTIDTAALSAETPPIKEALAGSYSRMLGTGENTVATRLSVFRQAVVFVVLGGYGGMVAYFLGL